MKMTVLKKHSLFAKTLCCLWVVLLVFSLAAPCLASAVKLPVFTQLPEDKTFVAGTGTFIEAAAQVFSDSRCPIRYSLEILRGDRFFSEGESYVRNSGEVARVKLVTGKGSALLLNHGTYTARLRAASLDEDGNEMAVGYCPAFKIEVLPPVIKDVSAQARVSYGESFSVSLGLNGGCTDSSLLQIYWSVTENGVTKRLKEGDVINGIVFTGTETAALHTEGTPEKISVLQFFATVTVPNASKSVNSESVAVEYRPKLVTGFCLGGSGMRFFDSDGQCVTGWLSHRGKLYFFDTESGIMKTGTCRINGEIYLFGTNGALINGFVKCPLGSRYYRNGVAVDGWHTVEGVDYYFDPYLRCAVLMIDENGETVPLRPVH